MKHGWIGIALAFAIYCGMLVHAPKRFTTSTPDGVEDIARKDPSFIPVHRTELVLDMSMFLWPEASLTLKDGPVDAFYYPLSAERIAELLTFHKLRRENYPYIRDAWDCDDFAHEFTYLARVWSVRQLPGVPIVPAVGTAYVHIDGFYPLFPGAFGVFNHAINVILRDDGQWLFYEPQNGLFVPIEGSIYEGCITVIRINI